MASPYVLVTYDNNMPLEHPEILRDCNTTLAIIDKKHLAATGLTEEQYWREVIHRHTHRIAEQPRATIFLYRCSDKRTLVKL